jgi:hypothetical protein
MIGAWVIRGKTSFPQILMRGSTAGTGAEGIEKAVHSGCGNAETGTFAFEDFLIFSENRVADNEFELLPHQPREDFVGYSVSRPEGCNKDIGVELGADHGEFGLERHNKAKLERLVVCPGIGFSDVPLFDQLGGEVVEEL